jgi:zinc ribbon protein
MAVQQRAFCGNCGAPLAPGAPFCGRCGTPVPVPAQVAAVAPGYPAYPAYAYPRAQPAPGRIGRNHTTQIAVAMGLVFLLILGGVIVSLVALTNNTGSHSACIKNCGPKIGTALPEQATYTSSQFGFQVDYDASWTVQKKTGASVQISTDNGGVVVMGQRASTPLGQVISGFARGLPSASYQDVTAVGDVKGAHLGDQNGLGTIYSANFIDSNSNAIKVRFAVIAATKNGVTVLMFAINPADTKNFPSGIPEGQRFDYMCAEFRWAS